ncbi:RDD family protein [Lysobacter firmicutimachus]|uniref:RDD family protein n=1 Tax=Lysobacter firmicutimachus TaxID=1792846 RepID=A0AAU8MWS2_9GAMM|nr:RDD family protein [Lysobacter antibioticus]
MEEPQNPYAAPSALPVAGEDYSVRADRGTRLIARLIDGALYMVCMAPVFVAVAVDPNSEQPSPLQLGIMSLGLLFALALFAYNLVLLAQSGQTLGKRWLKIKIVRLDGSPASLGRILGLRMIVIGLIESVPCLGALFSLANALWIFGDESRCLHDLLADTKVINA